MMNPGPAQTPDDSSPHSIPFEHRRGFMMQALTVVIGGIVSIVPVLAGVFVFLDPARRKRGAGSWIRVATLDGVPDDGIPRYFPVVVEQRDDAWTRFLNEPVGAVYLIREPGKQAITAFTATCPHAGCMVDYLEDKKHFQCPCHTSAFDCQGKRMLEISTVPPRDMDSLECRVEGGKDGSPAILVKFQEFYTGHTDKAAKV